MASSLIPRSFGTHDGSFHADEVTACSLLLLFHQIDRDHIYRTRDPKILARCEYVCDVGGLYDPKKHRFDHHQIDYTGPLSSAGMVLLYLKEENAIDSHLYDFFNRSLILGVDAHDNGTAQTEIGTATFSHVVSHFLPIEYEAPREKMEKAFFEALEFVVTFLKKLRERFHYMQACRKVVEEQMGQGKAVLFFDHPIPWMENFFDLGGEGHPAQFVIMPSGQHWKLRGIPPNLRERMQVRVPLPESWAGLHEEELRKASGIRGAVFCHKGRFISIWETKEDAVKALHIALKEK